METSEAKNNGWLLDGMPRKRNATPWRTWVVSPICSCGSAFLMK